MAFSISKGDATYNKVGSFYMHKFCTLNFWGHFLCLHGIRRGVARLKLFRLRSGDPKIPLGSENPKEYLSLALYLTFPVSKSPSIAVLIGALTTFLVH